ncbi:MAG: hypothetical protein ACYDG5_08650, partial [Dehalococcoidales bacterium]
MLAALGYTTNEVSTGGDLVSGTYRIGILLVAIPIVTLAVRNLHIFSKMLKRQTNPIVHNQVIAIMLGISVLTLATSLSLAPTFRAFPVSHYGNLINAFILSYAVIRHRLVDIKLVIRRGTA